jgi:hypothetical protein
MTQKVRVDSLPDRRLFAQAPDEQLDTARG